MYCKCLTIAEAVFDDVKDLITHYDEPLYTNIFENGIQMLYENSSVLNENTYTIIVLIIKHLEKTNISLIASGARKIGIIQTDWGTEKVNINKMVDLIESWCQDNNIDYSIEEDGYID